MSCAVLATQSWPWRGEHTALNRAHIPQEGDVVPTQWSVAGARREGSPGEGCLTKSGSPEGDHCVDGALRTEEEKAQG